MTKWKKVGSCWPRHEAQQAATYDSGPPAAATAYMLLPQMSLYSWCHHQLASCNSVFDRCKTHDELAAQRLGRIGLPHCQTHEPIAQDAAGEGLKSTQHIQGAAILAFMTWLRTMPQRGGLCRWAFTLHRPELCRYGWSVLRRHSSPSQSPTPCLSEGHDQLAQLVSPPKQPTTINAMAMLPARLPLP